MTDASEEHDSNVGEPSEEGAQAEEQPASADAQERDDDAETGRAGPSLPPSAADLGPPPNPFLRATYYALWFALVPILLVVILVWSLTPPSGQLESGMFAPIQAAVRSQPVPIAIVLFIFAVSAFAFVGHRLPLAEHAHPHLPEGVPDAYRAAFVRARQLVDEARLLRAKHGPKVSGRARQAARDGTHSLEAAMVATPFDPKRFDHALTALDDILEARFSQFRKGEVREFVEAIGFALALAFALRAFVIEAFKIPSGSMIPTLQVGDHIFVNKFIYGPAIPFTSARLWKNLPPKRGDVIVFAYPEDPQLDFIKRVIALPGDRLEAHDGHPVINGWEVPSCLVGTYEFDQINAGKVHRSGQLFVEYLGDESYLTLYYNNQPSSGVQGPYLVEGSQAFVMGDNRHDSKDSRLWFDGRGGGVPFESIRGKALFVWLSAGPTGMDWSRMGAPVMGRPRLPAELAHLNAPLDKCLHERPAVTYPPEPK